MKGYREVEGGGGEQEGKLTHIVFINYLRSIRDDVDEQGKRFEFSSGKRSKIACTGP